MTPLARAEGSIVNITDLEIVGGGLLTVPSVRRPDSGGQAGKQPAARLCLSGRRTDGRWPGWGSFAELENPASRGLPLHFPADLGSKWTQTSLRLSPQRMEMWRRSGPRGQRAAG